jgi:hypothetical protein
MNALAKGVALLIHSKLHTLRRAVVIVAVAVPAGFAGVAVASSSSPGSPVTVTVRVEGLKRTLLAPSKVKTHAGSITKSGTPKGACPATSAAGALDGATHHQWSGDYTKSYGLEVISILGESHPFTPAKDYWEVFVNNVAAQAGVCALSLHPGDQLLFAAVPDTGPSELPIAVKLPGHGVAGQAFTAKVSYYDAKGKAKPLAGATVSGIGKSAKSSGNGTVRLTPSKDGSFVVQASKHGYIRSTPTLLQVTG